MQNSPNNLPRPVVRPPTRARMGLESAPTGKPLPLIHLNGFPGTGKLTIARALQELLRYRLVHNHLLINPADAVLRRTEPGYQDLRRGIRGAVFSPGTPQRTPPPTSSPTNSFELATKVYGTRRTLRGQCCASEYQLMLSAWPDYWGKQGKPWLSRTFKE
ncbi:hypothetical protein G6O67_006620 [Ophiocordyceps sinensis]|uniref:Uncharacterized protein n=2 Tax=Ophiocordyceps sinensis TaxID=72228 RepID=A0A8H4PMY7_9HYPO|nr:hypothetical protein OCS_02679 [Ophiocordyceps sinensis CO18]KAF4506546.1 hypothetical protein G6O67_006620 [Ophiocordyceps sinensis]